MGVVNKMCKHTFPIVFDRTDKLFASDSPTIHGSSFDVASEVIKFLTNHLNPLASRIEHLGNEDSGEICQESLIPSWSWFQYSKGKDFCYAA